MVKKITIQVTHSILIQRTVETVWDFTQDFSKRTTWDNSLLECSLLPDESERKAFIHARGGMKAFLVYKQFERPHKTSLRMTEIRSPLILDGGGSWTYEPLPNHSTLWTQSNSIILKRTRVNILLTSFLKWIFMKQTIRSMMNAKRLLEQNA